MKSIEEIYRRVADDEIVYRRPSEMGCLMAWGIFFPATLLLAITNLLDGGPDPLFGQIASFLWLSVLALVLWTVFEKGLRAAVFNFRSTCARERFIQVTRDPDPLLSIGFRFRGRRYHELKVRGSGITGLEWSPGQNSCIYYQNTGKKRDLHDWHVAIWFQNEKVELGNGHLFLPGLQGSEEETRQFGRLLGKFLVENGIDIRLATDEILGKTGVVAKRNYHAYEIEVDDHTFRTIYTKQTLEPGTKVRITGQQGTDLDIEPIK